MKNYKENIPDKISFMGNGLPTYAQKEAQANFFMANEYMDFIEFLDDELGVEERKELQEKFYKKMDNL